MEDRQTEICSDFTSLPVLDLSWADDKTKKPILLEQLRQALYHIGFLYIINHGVSQSTISALTSRLPALFDLPQDQKKDLSKLNSPHFLGYSGYAEEITLGKADLREQFDLATELPVVYKSGTEQNGTTQNGTSHGRDLSKLYWGLRGPNQWPPEDLVPGFKEAFTRYHDEVQALSYRFVHLVEEAFEIPVGIFDEFFGQKTSTESKSWMPPQHRIKLVKYPPDPSSDQGQGVGAHKDSSGWLTFLYQVGKEEGLEVVSSTGDWIPARPIEGSFVVNFGNAFEAATEGAVKATVHRVVAPKSAARYSIPFFQGLPLDMTVDEVKSFIPTKVRSMRGQDAASETTVSAFLDPRWSSLGESQLRKWIRSHPDVGRRWYGDEVVEYYTA